MFRPMTNSIDERVELIKNSMSKDIADKALQECETLEDFYWFAEKVQNGVSAQMELYILENFEKLPLEIWNKGSFRIHPHTGTDRIRFGKEDVYVPKQNKTLDKLFKGMHDKSTKITSIKFVLDEHDGDFSVTFNEGPWAFLWKDDILDYYIIIKNYLDYLSLRDKRNNLRDEFNSSTSIIKTGKLKEKIEKLDIKLSEYESRT